jgi:uncharacterized phage protein gp47/JayE
MGFAIPSLADSVERARRMFRVYLPGSDAWLWPNNIGPTAKVIGGFITEVFGFADYIAKQIFALTADSEHLDLHGEEFGLARRPAAPARGRVRFTASTALTVASAARVRRGDGAEYLALSAASLPGAGTLDVDFVAVTDGKAGSAIGGTPLEIVSGVTGTALAEAGVDGILGGDDSEDDESFRARILFRKRNPPHGGAAADYVAWAGSVSGVSVTNGLPDVFVERLWSGAGSVRVFVLMRDLYPDGIAPPAEIDRVAAFIDSVRPSGAIVTVAAPRPHPINVQISGLVPDTAAMRETVLAELRASVRRLAKVAGTDTPHGGMPFLAIPQSFSRSWLWQAVANASGEERHSIALPASDIALSPGEIASLGTVTFV